MASDWKQTSDYAYYRVLHHCFMTYLAEHDLSTEDATKVAIADFVEWVATQYLQECNREDVIETMAGLGIKAEDFNYVSQAMSVPRTAFHLVNCYWSLLCLAPRPPLKRKIKDVRLFCMINYDDGVSAQMNMMADNTDIQNFTDALVVGALQRGLRMVTKQVEEHGCDKLYDVVTSS